MPRRALPYSVRVRSGSSYWQYRIEGMRGYKPSPIKVLCKADGSPRNRTQAETWAAEEWRKAGGRSPETGPTFRDYLLPFFVPGFCPHIARVLNDKGRYSLMAAKNHRSRIDRFVYTDRIADIPLADLRPGHFEDFKGRLKTTHLSNRTINILLGALKTALREGVHRGDLAADPSAGVGALKESPEELGIFSRAEVSRIITEPDLFDSGHYPRAKPPTPDHLARLFFLLLAVSGERPAAILDLCWGDVDGDTLHFQRTKTTNGRAVPIIGYAVRELEAFRGEDEAPVFGYVDGTRCGGTFYAKRFRTMMKKAGFPALDEDGRRRKPYSLKHSLITHLVDAGADEVLVREYVGHSHGYGSTRILTRVQATYKHRQAERLREILPWIERIYFL